VSVAQHWVVSQIGARQAYAVPRAFALRGALRALFTDAWSPLGGWLPPVGPRLMRALAGRYHPDLATDRVVAFTGTVAARRLYHAVVPTSDNARFYRRHLGFGQWFDRRVLAGLRGQSFDAQVDRFFGFNTGCLETMRWFRANGVPAVVDQVDPARVEQDIIERERLRWPGWKSLAGRIPEEYFERLDAEWREADRVVVNSRWTADALVTQGVPPKKIVIIPQAYEPSGPRPAPRDAHRRRLTVLWIGSVLLRKGIPYLVEAARQLPGVRFVVVGAFGITDAARATAPANLEWVGPVNRDRVAGYYAAADVFVLPTLSDGFAITQLEAMSYGLPVIATPNCGEVVTDGHDGFVVAPADAAELARKLAAFDSDRVLLATCSLNALATAKRFDLAAMAERLLRLFPCPAEVGMA